MIKNSQRGMALPLVMIISAFLLLMGGVMLKQEIGETVFRVDNEEKTQAYYLARSGAEAIFDTFQNDRANALELLHNNMYTETPTAFGDGTISVEVFDNRSVQVGGHNKNEIIVRSTGAVGNATEVVILDLIFTPALTGYDVFSYPLYSKGEIKVGADFNFDLSGGGKIATEQVNDDLIDLLPQTNITLADIDFDVDGSTYTTPVFPTGVDLGNITMGNGDYMVIRKDPGTGKVRVTVDYNTSADTDTGWFDGNIYIPTFSATGGGNLDVYVPINDDIKMICDDFTSKIQLEIISIDTDGSLWTDNYPMDDNGTPLDPSDDTLDFAALQTYTGDIDGVFELYATNSMTFQTGASVIANTPNAFFAIVDDGATFDFISNGDFKGYVYGPGADVDISSSGSEFSGAIIANNVDINNGADYEFYPFFATDIPSGFMNSLNYGIAIESWN
jgi:hypothetical protein